MTGPDISLPDDDGGSGAEPGGPSEQNRPWDPQRGPSPADPLSPLTVCPPFRPDTVSVGPFDREPFELQPITWHLQDGTVRPGPDNVRCLAEWLTGALDAAGVTLGAFDRLQAHLIASDGWGPVQAVAGWITRAHANPPPAEDPPPAGAPVPQADPAGPDPQTREPPDRNQREPNWVDRDPPFPVL